MDFCRISTSLSMQKRMPVMGFYAGNQNIWFYIDCKRISSDNNYCNTRSGRSTYHFQQSADPWKGWNCPVWKSVGDHQSSGKWVCKKIYSESAGNKEEQYLYIIS